MVRTSAFVETDRLAVAAEQHHIAAAVGDGDIDQLVVLAQIERR